MARAADAEERLAQAQALRASAERQAEQAITCLQSLMDSANEDAASRELLRVCTVWCPELQLLKGMESRAAIDRLQPYLAASSAKLPSSRICE